MTVSGPFKVSTPATKRSSEKVHWKVNVRTGDLIQGHRFTDESEAAAFAKAIKRNHKRATGEK